MNETPIIGENNKKENGVIFDDDRPTFKLTSLTSDVSNIFIYSKKDEKGDYPALFIEIDGKKAVVWRDEMTAATFALSRQDQQYKLLDARFREYKEVPVRLIIQTTKDLKKGDYVVAWRKERVPIDFNYNKI